MSAAATDPPAEVLARIAIARARARLGVAEAGRRFQERFLQVFRDELTACVNGVSPLLIGVLERDGMLLDEVAWLFEPARGWPFGAVRAGRRNPLPIRTTANPDGHGRRRTVGPILRMGGGGWVRIQVLDDCIEVLGRVDGVRIATTRGMARLTVAGGLPTGLARLAIDRPIGAVVRSPFLVGRDWPVTAVETSPGRVTFTIETGIRPYAPPWSRPP